LEIANIAEKVLVRRCQIEGNKLPSKSVSGFTYVDRKPYAIVPRNSALLTAAVAGNPGRAPSVLKSMSK
jgi:hypothetical protein